MTSHILSLSNQCPEAFSYFRSYLQPQDLQQLSYTCKHFLLAKCLDCFVKRFPAMPSHACGPFERKSMTISYFQEKIKPQELAEEVDRAIQNKCFSIFLEIFLEAGAKPCPVTVQRAIESRYPLRMTLI